MEHDTTPGIEKMPDTPLISIVIPTAGRAGYLAVAIASALDDWADEVEVIVVPNGPSQSWKAPLAKFSCDARVRVVPCAVAHANAARNVGLSAARGRFVRFLDDDDFLYPGASRHQCGLMQQTGLEICTGVVATVTTDGAVFGTRIPIHTDDFVESVLSPWHVSLPTAHVYLRTCLSGIQWDEMIPLAQDKHWVYNLCKVREWRWGRTDFVVGAWRNHSGPRISGQVRLATQSKVWALYLLDAVEALQAQDRLNVRRHSTATIALWRLICGHFFMAPRFWDGILRRAAGILSGSYPNLWMYRTTFAKKFLPPRALLLTTVPLQALYYHTTVQLARAKHKTFAIPR